MLSLGVNHSLVRVDLRETPPDIINSLNFCINHEFLWVNAYVVMQTHLHATLFDVEFNVGA
jgi:hypothetical protein